MKLNHTFCYTVSNELFIWSQASKDDYVLRKKPKDQRIPEKQDLKVWYDKNLDKLQVCFIKIQNFRYNTLLEK